MSKKAIGRSTYPTVALRTALIFYFAYGASTSGVEQSFSKGSWAYTNRQLKSLPTSEEMILKLTLDLPKENKQKVINMARSIWAHCYGLPRVHTTTRLDAGVKRKLSDPDQSDGAKKIRTELDVCNARRDAWRQDASSSSSGLDFMTSKVKTWSQSYCILEVKTISQR